MTPLPTPDVVSAIVGIVVSLLLKLLKRQSWLKDRPALVKQIIAVITAGVIAGLAHGKFDAQAVLQGVYAALFALGTHGLVLGPIERDAQERAANPK